jgi:hypothetical protein
VHFCVNTAPMSWWGESRTAATVAEPAPPIDRFGEAQNHIHELKTELDALDREMRPFKTAHHVSTDRFGRLLSIQCATLTGRAAVKKTWRELLTRRDKLVPQWHAALHEFAQLKMEIR